MAKQIYTVDNTHDGSTESVDREKDGRQATHMWHYYNSLDVSVTITFYGTRKEDDDFSEAIQIGSQTISSNGNGGYETMTDPWEQVRIEFSYGASPSSGSFTVYENSERW